MDRKWWNHYQNDVYARFEGERISTSANINKVRRVRMDHFGNSGAAMISLAISRGAKRVYLLGYDCHSKGGVHWHGDHPRGMGNARSMPQWHKHFKRLADTYKNIEIVNCSPGTALTCFKLGKINDILQTDTLRDGLGGQPVPAGSCPALG